VAAAQKHAMSIRRIVAGALLLFCLGLNVLALVYIRQEHKLIETTIAAVTIEHGKAWAQLCKDTLKTGNRPGLDDIVDSIAQGTGVRLAMVVDERGRVIASSDPARIGKKHQVEHDMPADEQPAEDPCIYELHPEPGGFFHETGHTFEFCFPMENGQKQLGHFVVLVNTAWGNKQAETLAVKGLLSVLTLTLLVGLGAFALDWRLRKAIKALIFATHAIAKGERLPSLSLATGGELGLLGDSVRQMAGALQETEERVSHWHRKLEATITQRTAQLEESQQLLAEREKMAALGLMAAGIVHEVGNPLTAMSAIVQRMQRKANGELGDKCRVLLEQINRISRIVDDMRQVARPVSTKGSSTNVNETLRMAIKVTQYDPRSKKAAFHADLAPDVPRVSGHADRWQQVFINLIMNALDAMPQGGRLSVCSAISGQQVIVTFRDTGRGMNAEEIKNLYHPFFTTKASGGMGLGLSVCNSIVRSYGGEITVVSQLQKGTTFRIAIPPYIEGVQTDEQERGETSEKGNAGVAIPTLTNVSDGAAP